MNTAAAPDTLSFAGFARLLGIKPQAVTALRSVVARHAAQRAALATTQPRPATTAAEPSAPTRSPWASSWTRSAQAPVRRLHRLCCWCFSALPPELAASLGMVSRCTRAQGGGEHD